MTATPKWPPWTVPLALLGILAAGLLATLLAAAIGVAAGSDHLTPALVVLAALLSAAATWLVLRAVSRRAGIDLEPAHVGLRPVTPRLGLVVFAFGLAIALIAGGLSALLWHPLHGVHVPEELSRQPGTARRLGDPDPTVVGLTAATLLDVLGRAVIGAIAAEVVLRGFVLPALIAWRGRTLAIVLVAVLSAVTGNLDLAPAAAAIGVALCVMYLESGSILPGIALDAGVLAFVQGQAFGWTAAESAALAGSAALAALALVLPLARTGPSRAWDPGPAAG